MAHAQSASASPSTFDIWFASLFNEGQGLLFPCDEAGQVQIDALSERGRRDYFFARATLGREYARPRVVCREDSSASTIALAR